MEAAPTNTTQTAIVVGTHRTGSLTRQLAAELQHRLAQVGTAPAMVDLALLPPDFLHADLFGRRSEAFRPLEDLMRQADRFLFVVPEYNGSYPGVLKLFLDSMVPKEVYWGKRAALVGLSAGKFGALRGLEHLAGVLNYLRMTTMPHRAHLMRLNSNLPLPQQLTEEHQAELATFLAAFQRF